MLDAGWNEVDIYPPLEDPVFSRDSRKMITFLGFPALRDLRLVSGFRKAELTPETWSPFLFPLKTGSSTSIQRPVPPQRDIFSLLAPQYIETLAQTWHVKMR